MKKMTKLVQSSRCVWLSKTKVKKDNCTNFKDGKVIYWMWRDQRCEDNWALLKAQEIAERCGSTVSVLFVLVPNYLEYSSRHFGFMLKGMKETERLLAKKNIPLEVTVSTDPVKKVLDVMKKNAGGVLVSDFTPLRENTGWTADVQDGLAEMNIPFCQVDAHNVVPYNVTSQKCEYAARTIRRKIMDRLDDYLDEFPPVKKQNIKVERSFDYDRIWSELKNNGMDTSVKEVDESIFKAGYTAGMENLEDFCSSKYRLERFGSHRNDPNHPRALSRMSPYFHFGQVSAQRAVMEAKISLKSRKSGSMRDGVAAFIEESVVRRELSDNFCYYNENYDNLKGAYEWAQNTLKIHKKDKREFTYSYEEFAESKTHDKLWNAAQLQLVNEGKMHGFLRMYWAKKILEWSSKPRVALKTAQKLNDRFALDGNDPNGFVGVGWSIMGIHDQGWREREIFGKIRYMNFAGCKRKFDVQGFIDKTYQQFKSTKANKKRVLDSAKVTKPNSKFARISK